MNQENREMRPPAGFEEQKQVFFTRLGLRARGWLKTHRDLGGLWEGKKGERWENVSEHCLVEAARIEKFSEVLGLRPDSRADLFAAAVVHDFNKKEELLNTGASGRTPESFDKAYAAATEKLVKAGVPEKIVAIADSVGHASAGEMERLLAKQELDEQDIARLVMHYVDDYTLGSEWVKPAEAIDNGVIANDFDRRMKANQENPKYAKIAAAGFYKEQYRVGLAVEGRLAKLILERSGQNLDPKLLPEYIDQKIKDDIQNEK